MEIRSFIKHTLAITSDEEVVLHIATQQHLAISFLFSYQKSDFKKLFSATYASNYRNYQIRFNGRN